MAVTLLALGTISTIATAWGLAAWLPHTGLTLREDRVPLTEDILGPHVYINEFRRTGLQRRAWWITAFHVPGSAVKVSRLTTFSMAAQSVARIKETPQETIAGGWGALPAVLLREPPASAEGLEDARGWPWPCLFFQLEPDDSPAAIARGHTLHLNGGIAISPLDGSVGPGELRAIPFRPIWRATIGDLAVQTAILAAAWWSWKALRGWWRRARGLCKECAYNLRGLPPNAPCPECGPGTAVAATSEPA
jgi:hypothetical protein